MPIICPYSCYIGLYCTIPSYRPSGFAARDDAYDVMLGLHHNAERRAVSPTDVFSAAPIAADDDFLDFSHDDINFISIFVL